MESRLSGKVALITGAASGIGRAIALRFAKEGAKVSIVDINLEGAKKVVSEVKGLGGKALAVRCDVADEESVGKAIEETEKKLGRIGILVSNAGILTYNLIHDIKTEQWREIFKVNVDGLFYLSRALIKTMQ